MSPEAGSPTNAQLNMADNGVGALTIIVISRISAAPTGIDRFLTFVVRIACGSDSVTVIRSPDGDPVPKFNVGVMPEIGGRAIDPGVCGTIKLAEALTFVFA